MAPNVGLADAPGGFTQGCHPQSTTYCRSGHQGSAAVSTTSVRTASVAAPTYSPAPVMQAPIVAPQPHMPRQHVQERVVAIGGGFDPSKFTPRIYGDPYTITPGIAYLPTSIVDRNPYRAQAVLDAGPGGVTPALTGMPIGPLPTPRPYRMAAPQTAMMAPRPPVMMHQPMMQAPNVHAPQAYAPRVQPYMMQRPMVQAPMMHPRPQYMSGPQVQPSIPTGHPGAAGAPYKMSHGRYGSTVGADGTYWEKVSGPTQIGNMTATQVICKRRLPQPAPRHYPTPYPAPQPMPPVTCNAQAQQPSAHTGGQRSRY
jgi:hypothetical protein